MSDTAQEILWHVLGDELGQTCSMRDVLLEVPRMQSCVAPNFEYTLPIATWWWFVNTFVDDPNEIQRIKRAVYEIRQVFLDLNKIHYAWTGESKPLPERLIRCLEMRLLAAMRPSAYEMATGARRHSAAVASKHLKERTTEAQWLMKLSSLPARPRRMGL